MRNMEACIASVLRVSLFFNRGQGQLKTAMDVIITAKVHTCTHMHTHLTRSTPSSQDVARAGEYLFFITKPIAEKVVNPLALVSFPSHF